MSKSNLAAKGCGGCVTAIALCALLLVGLYVWRWSTITPEEVAAHEARQAVSAQRDAEHQAELDKTRAEQTAKNAEVERVQQEKVEGAVGRARAGLPKVKELLEKVDTEGLWFDSLAIEEVTLKITVKDPWHLQHKQIRLQTAQDLWKVWSGIVLHPEPDRVRLELVDRNGNAVGGSRMLAGSLIYVND